MEEVILSTGGEGGKIDILGERTDQGWRFCLERNESPLGDLFDEEDRDLIDTLVLNHDGMII